MRPHWLPIALAVLVGVALTGPVQATIRIRWDHPSVTEIPGDPYYADSNPTATFTGVTEGDQVLSFTATFTVVGGNLGNQEMGMRVGQSGGQSNALITDMLDSSSRPRGPTSRVEIKIRLDGGSMVNPQFLVVDIDRYGPSYAWQDQVVVNTAGAQLSVPQGVNPVYNINPPNTATAVRGSNQGPTQTGGNVLVSFPNLTIAELDLTYRPGPLDAFTANQLIGLSTITFDGFEPNPPAVPEPSAWLLFGCGVGVLLYVRRRQQADGNIGRG